MAVALDTANSKRAIERVAQVKMGGKKLWRIDEERQTAGHVV